MGIIASLGILIAWGATVWFLSSLVEQGRRALARKIRERAAPAWLDVDLSGLEPGVAASEANRLCRLYPGDLPLAICLGRAETIEGLPSMILGRTAP